MPTKGEIQAVVFSKDKWTEDTSKQWLIDHQYIHLKLDRKGKSFRYSLRNKEDYHHFRSKKDISEGVSFVFGYHHYTCETIKEVLKLNDGRCVIKDCGKKATKVISIRSVNDPGDKAALVGVCEEHKQSTGGELGMRNLAASFLPKFDWEKYTGEKHLPGYNYAGPGTRLDLRLDIDGNPKPGEEPINELDRIAYLHDRRYNKAGDNLDIQHNADLIMLEDLEKMKPQSLMERFFRYLCEKIISAKVKLGMGLENLGEWEPKERKKYEGMGIDFNELVREYGSL